MEYNEIEIYIIDKLSNNTRISSKKLAAFYKHNITPNLSNGEMYSIAKKIEIPKCATCEINSARFISFSKGYGKFCSKKCYSVFLSNSNIKNNSELSKKISEKTKNEKQKTANLLIDAANYYKNNPYETIKTTAIKFSVSHSWLREFLKENNLIDKKRQNTVFNTNNDIKFANINSKIDNFEWINNKIDNGYTSKAIADELGCSKNYVAVRARENGTPLPISCNSSSYEIKIQKFLEDNNINFEIRNRKILEGKEIDIFIKDFNIAIEINGSYWHQSVDETSKYRHMDKTNMCLAKNIRLIHLFDFDIDNKENIVKSILLSALNKNKQKIYARRCVIKEIDSKTFNTFNKDNHLQGSINSSVRLGLFLNDDLVCVMGFSKSRFNKNYQYELTRFVNKRNINVIGGSSKLFKYFIKQYKPISVISYCQRRLYTGSMYEKIGMRFERYTPPNYIWVNVKNNKYIIKTRYQTQKHLLIGCDNNTTENEYMKKLNFYKIYDSGQSVYVWNNFNGN